MKKVKKLYSRKRRALRRLALLLAALLTCNYVFHFAYLLPIQALRYGEDLDGGYERTKVVAAFRVPEFNRRARFYLTAGENSVNLIGVRWTVAGWLPSTYAALDCSDDAPVHAAQVSLHFDKHSYTAVYFGRVDDAEVAFVQLADLEPMEGVYKGFSSSADVNANRDGRRYFVLEVHEALRRPVLELWYEDGDGLRVERYDIETDEEWFRSSIDFYG